MEKEGQNTFASDPTMVRLDRIPSLEAALSKIAKKAAKLECEPPTMMRTGRDEIREKRVGDEVLKFRWVEVVVSGEVPRFPGWELVAVVDHEDGVTDAVPGKQCPPEQRDRGPVCDHCNRRDPRRRKTMVLRRDGSEEVVQVGTTCIGDFLGSLAFSPQLALAYAEMISELVGSMEMDSDDEGFLGWGGGRMAIVASIEEILTWTAGWLVNNPWISGSHARNTNSTSTSSHVASLIWPPSFDYRGGDEDRREYEAAKDQAREAITDKHRDEVETAIAWVIEASESNPESDYLAACATLAANGYATARRFGYVCSILTSYRRHVERQEQRTASRPKLNEHLGQAGERIVIELRLVADPTPIEGEWGRTYLHVLRSSSGHLLKWFGSWRIGDGGTVMVAKATIKRHSEYNGWKETHLTRVSPIVEGEGAAMEAARELLAAEGHEVARPADDLAMAELGTAVKYMKRAKVWRLAA